MATDRNNDFVLTHYLSLTRERDTTLDQVPFFLSLRHNPPVLRRVLEAILAGVNWETACIAVGGYSVVPTDVVLLVDSAGGVPAEVTLPAVTAGRVLVFKDKDGNASNNGILIHVNDIVTDSIDDSASTTFNLNADYGAVVFVAATCSGDNKWFTIAIV